MDWGRQEACVRQKYEDKRHRRELLTYPKKKKEGEKEATVCTRMSDRRKQDLATSEAVRTNERKNTKMDRNIEGSVEGACVKTNQTERRDTRGKGWKESNMRLEEVVPEGRGRTMGTTRACKDTLGPRGGWEEGEEGRGGNNNDPDDVAVPQKGWRPDAAGDALLPLLRRHPLQSSAQPLPQRQLPPLWGHR